MIMIKSSDEFREWPRGDTIPHGRIEMFHREISDFEYGLKVQIPYPFSIPQMQKLLPKVSQFNTNQYLLILFLNTVFHNTLKRKFSV